MLNDINFSIHNLHDGINFIIKKIDEISETLKNFETKQRIKDIRTLGKNAKLYRDTLINTLINSDELSQEIELKISEFLNNFSTFLEGIIVDILRQDINSEEGLRIIYTLGVTFADLSNLFSMYYFRKHKNQCPNYNDWLILIDSIGNNAELSKQLKELIMLQAPDVSPFEKKRLFDNLNCSFSDYSYQLQVNSHDNKTISEKYGNRTLDEILEEKIKKDELLIID